MPHLHGDLGLHGGVGAEGSHADGGARVPAALAPELDEQVGFAVHDLGHVVEVRPDADVADDLHDALDRVEVAQRRLDHGEMVEGAVARHRVALLDGYRLAEAALVLQASSYAADVAADE